MDMGALYYNLANYFALDLPERITEDEGTIQGKITIDFTHQYNIIVNFFTKNISQLKLQGSATISAGNTSAFFEIKVINNDNYNKPFHAQILATIPNRGTIYKTIIIEDDDLTINIDKPVDGSPFNENLEEFKGWVEDKNNNIKRIELLISNSTNEIYSTSKSYPQDDNDIKWSFDSSSVLWNESSDLYTITATAYNSIGYSCSSSIQYGMINTEITCNISEKQAVIGKSILVSGNLSPIPNNIDNIPVVDIEVCYEEDTNCSTYSSAAPDINGNFSIYFHFNKVGPCNIKSKWEGVSNFKSTESDTIDFVVQKGYPTLTVNASSYQIKTDGKINIHGELEYNVGEMQGLNDKTIMIKMTSDNEEYTETIETNGIYGQYELNDINIFTKPAQWTVQTIFEGTDDYEACESMPITINVVETVGYAIIVPGNGPDIDLYTKTTDFVYYQLKQRSFLDDDINYFNDQHCSSTKQSIKNSITEKTNDRNLKYLYIIFVGHGSENNFYLKEDDNVDDNNSITPIDLNEWMTEFQADDNPTKIVAILGFCNSGSFIDELSGKNRIIITSAAKDESSYKGLKELDNNCTNRRDGEYFISELFRQFSLGLPIKNAFEEAVKYTERYTFDATIQPKYPYFDYSLQHPLLDDNNDGFGSNELSDPTGDGGLCNSIYLGTSASSQDIKGLSIERVADTIYLFEDTDFESKLIWAEIDAGDLLKLNPISNCAKIDTEEEPNVIIRIQIKHHKLDAQNDIMDSLDNVYKLSYKKESNKWELNQPLKFNDPGMYQVFYYAIYKGFDEQIVSSSLMETLVYREDSENPDTPELELTSPINTIDYTHVKLPLLLHWEHVEGYENNFITYTVKVVKKFFDTEEMPNDIEVGFADIYKQNLIDNFVVINSNLQSDNTYYWQVKAIDKSGVFSKSDIWAFNILNMHNDPEGKIEVQLIDSKNRNEFIKDATITLNSLYSLEHMGDGKYVCAGITPSFYRVSVSNSSGYFNIVHSGFDIQPIGIAKKTFCMIPIIMGDVNVNTHIEIGDAVKWLALISNPSAPFFTEIPIPIELQHIVELQNIILKASTSFEQEVDVNGDNIPNLSEVIYTLQRLINID